MRAIWAAPGRRMAGRALVVAIVGGWVAFGAAGSSNADWSQPKIVAPEIARLSALAVAPDGTATVAWKGLETAGIKARQFGPDGEPLGPVLELSGDADVTAVHAGAAADGSVLVAWSHGGSLSTRQLKARWIGPDGEPEPTTHDVATNLQRTDLAVAPDGRATLVWEDGSVQPSRIAVRQLLPGGAPTGKQFLSEAGETAGEPAVAVAKSGEAAGTVSVALIRIVGEGYVAQVRRISPEGVVDETSYNISPVPQSNNDSAYEPRIAVDAQGTATVAWQQASSSSVWIRARRLSADGTLGVPVDISGSGAELPVVGVAPNGDAVVGWAQRLEGDIFLARAREFGVTGELGDVLVLGPEPGTNAEDDRRWLEIVVPRNGRATLIWSLLNPEAQLAHVWSRDLVGGQLRKRVVLGENPSLLSRAAADAQGRVTAIWSHLDEAAELPMVQIAWLEPFARPNLRASAKARKRVKRGAKLAVKVRVQNRGRGAARGVRVCPRLQGKAKRAFKAGACKRVRELPAGKAKTVRLRLKAKRKLRPGARYKLGVIVNGRDADGARLPKRTAAVRVRGAR